MTLLDFATVYRDNFDNIRILDLSKYFLGNLSEVLAKIPRAEIFSIYTSKEDNYVLDIVLLSENRIPSAMEYWKPQNYSVTSMDIPHSRLW